MHHRRGKPKSKRAGCLLCKPHKHEAAAKVPGAKAALAVITERPNRSKGTWGPVDALVRFDGELVVDVETSDDFDWGIDYDDETDSNLELPLVVAPLRVSLFEVAALRSA